LDSSRLGVTAADTLSKRDTALFLKRFSVQSAPPASDTHPGIFAPTIKKTVQNQPRITVQKTGMASKPRIDLRVIIFSLSIMIIGLFVVFAVKKRRRPLFLTTTRLSVMDKEVQKTCRYIEKNFADPGLSVDSICKDLVTGAAFLEALFEKELGLDVEKFIEHVRINRARILIEENHGVSIDFAAKETGFSSSEVFAARFKKSVGTSFSEYCALRASQGNVQ
jgi:AraC-like DNA-binding protein